MIFSATILYIRGTPASSEIAIERYSFETGASFIVSKHGSTIYMRNGSTGAIEWSSSNASAVINACIGNLTDGGRIFVKAGTYLTSAPISDQNQDNIILIGEGTSTILRLSNSINDDIICLESVSGWKIAYLQLDGNKANNGKGKGCGVNIRLSNNIHILNVNIANTSAEAIRLGVGAEDIYGANDYLIQNCKLSSSNHTAILLISSDRGIISQNTIVNIGRDTSNGIFLSGSSSYGGCKNVIVTNNIVNTTDKGDVGIEVGGGNYDHSFISLGNNIIRGFRTGYHLWGGRDISINGGTLQGKNTTTGTGVSVGTSCPSNVVVTGLEISNYAVGFYFRRMAGFDFSNNRITECERGIQNAGVACSNITVTGGRIEYSNNHAVELSTSASNIIFSGVSIINNTERGFSFWNAITDIIIDSCQIIANGDEGVYIADGGSNPCGNITITDNLITDNTGWGIQSISLTDYLSITDNIIFDNSQGQISVVGGNNRIHNNLGFVTENSGTTSNAVNGTWVTHGLAGTPTVVTLTISGNNYVNASCHLLQPTVIASNSTHFQIGFYINNAGTITAVTSTYQRDIFWTCEYQP